MRLDSLTVKRAIRCARCGDCCAAEQPELVVPGRAKLRLLLKRDPLDVAQGEQAAEAILRVHHQQFVDAGMLGEKLVCDRDRVGPQFFFLNRLDLIAPDECIRNLFGRVPWLDDVAGKQTDQFLIVAHNREGAEGVALGVDPLEHLANRLVWGDRDRFLDQAVDVILDAANLLELLLVRHVVMDQAEPAV